MYAIVNIAGQQFKVEKGKKIFVHQLPGEIGTEISFDQVLLVSNKDKVSVGEPYINNALVSAQILSHLRGDKIKVFKKKRRKGYKVLKGHRQYFTELMIEDISETGLVKKVEKKKQPEMADVKQKEKKTGQVDKTTEKEVRKPEEKPRTAKAQAVKKVTGKVEEKSTSPVKTAKTKASRSKTTGKATTKSKTAKNTAEAKSKPAAKKVPAKKQEATDKKTDAKQK